MDTGGSADGDQRPPWVEMDIDMDQPGAERIYRHLVGDDRIRTGWDAVHQDIASISGLPAHAQANRAFLRRVVHFLVDAGIRQFLDLGSGIPTVGNVHEIAQAAAPESRIAYVDIDPIAVVHSRSILAGNPGAVAVLEDARNPEAILGHRTVLSMIDFDQPVALLLVAVLHHLAEEEDPHEVVARFAQALAPGSFLVLAHGAGDASTADTPPGGPGGTWCSTSGSHHGGRTGMLRFFDGFELVDPGVVWAEQWWPGRCASSTAGTGRSGTVVGVGRKPG
jgi:SAM-dependent methyltransferase